MSTATKPTSSYGGAWRPTVTCPGCGTEATIRPHHRPRFTCADVGCAFHHGWRLRPTAEVTHNASDGTPIRRIVAVPLRKDGSEHWAKQMPWPWPRKSEPKLTPIKTRKIKEG